MMIQHWHAPAAETKTQSSVAVLIDGENISQSQGTAILDVAEPLGTLNIRRVYGDMAKLRDWEADHRFTNHHTGHGRGKNTADINLVIDAMDMAHSKRATVFVIVSSDGDFTPLATRLREEGLVVIGLGRSRASQSFKDACTSFHAFPETADAPLAAQPEAPRLLSFAGQRLDASASGTVHREKPGGLSPLDDAIHSLCREEGGSSAKLALTSFGQLMPKIKGIKREDCGKATWSAYLSSAPALYILQGSGASLTVRLKTP